MNGYGGNLSGRAFWNVRNCVDDYVSRFEKVEDRRLWSRQKVMISWIEKAWNISEVSSIALCATSVLCDPSTHAQERKRFYKASLKL